MVQGPMLPRPLQDLCKLKAHEDELYGSGVLTTSRNPCDVKQGHKTAFKEEGAKKLHKLSYMFG